MKIHKHFQGKNLQWLFVFIDIYNFFTSSSISQRDVHPRFSQNHTEVCVVAQAQGGAGGLPRPAPPTAPLGGPHGTRNSIFGLTGIPGYSH